MKTQKKILAYFWLILLFVSAIVLHHRDSISLGNLERKIAELLTPYIDYEIIEEEVYYEETLYKEIQLLTCNEFLSSLETSSSPSSPVSSNYKQLYTSFFISYTPKPPFNYTSKLISKYPNRNISQSYFKAIKSYCANLEYKSKYKFSYFGKSKVAKSSSNIESTREILKIPQLNTSLSNLINEIQKDRIHCRKLIRVGGWSCEKKSDGAKPVCVDHLLQKDCLIYSFGVGHDFTFEQKMAKFGCLVFAFDDDSTHIKYPFQISPRLYFFLMRLGKSVNVVKAIELKEGKWETYVYMYRPLDNIMFILRHTNSPLDILKIDIEGTEWQLFQESIFKMDVLNRTKQLIIETHMNSFQNLTQVTEPMLLSNITKYYRFFETLRSFGFRPAIEDPNWVRPSYFSTEGLVIPLFSEFLWINTRFQDAPGRKGVPNHLQKRRDILENIK